MIILFHMIDTIGLLTDVESMLVFTFKLKHTSENFFESFEFFHDSKILYLGYLCYRLL